jgi:hypothetical protein
LFHAEAFFKMINPGILCVKGKNETSSSAPLSAWNDAPLGRFGFEKSPAQLPGQTLSAIDFTLLASGWPQILIDRLRCLTRSAKALCAATWKVGRAAGSIRRMQISMGMRRKRRAPHASLTHPPTTRYEPVIPAQAGIHF